MTPAEVLRLCRENDVKAVDLRFVDLLGTWHHTTIPVKKLDEDVFEDGLGFDGSSIRGWQSINESDMLMLPQANTAFVVACGQSLHHGVHKQCQTRCVFGCAIAFGQVMTTPAQLAFGGAGK